MKFFIFFTLVVISILGLCNADTKPVRCLQPKSADGDGLRSCMAFFRMFSYNAETNACEEFTYGGCGGNENRFATVEECQHACVTV